MLTILSVPTDVAPGASFSATFRVTNDSGAVWPVGGSTPVRIGSQSPENTPRWGTHRIVLTADLAPGASVDVVKTLTAPMQDAGYAFAWQMVKEGVGWIAPLVSQIVTVGAGGPPPSTILEPQIQLANLPAARTDGSITGALIMNVGPFSFGLGPRTATWTYTGAQPFAITTSRLWTGVDFNGQCDTYVHAKRAGAMVNVLVLDRYANPGGLHQVDVDYPEPGLILQPGETIDLWFFANAVSGQGSGTHAHHMLTIWGRYL